jgi:hypothetical protein
MESTNGGLLGRVAGLLVWAQGDRCEVANPNRYTTKRIIGIRNIMPFCRVPIHEKTKDGEKERMKEYGTRMGVEFSLSTRINLGPTLVNS